MKSDTINCPCCCQKTEQSTEVRVDINENRLYYRENSVKLLNRLADLAYVLADRMPNTVPHDTIIRKMWGDVEGDFAQTNVNVAVHQLRQVIRPMGLDIINNWGVGYRMTEMSRTETTPRPNAPHNFPNHRILTTLDDRLERDLDARA